MPPYMSLLAFSLTYALWIIYPFMILLLLYRCFKVSISQGLDARHPDIRKLELRPIASSGEGNNVALARPPAMAAPESELNSLFFVGTALFIIFLLLYRCLKVSISQGLEAGHPDVRRLQVAQLRAAAKAMIWPFLLLPWLLPSPSSIRYPSSVLSLFIILLLGYRYLKVSISEEHEAGHPDVRQPCARLRATVEAKIRRFKALNSPGLKTGGRDIRAYAKAIKWALLLLVPWLLSGLSSVRVVVWSLAWTRPFFMLPVACFAASVCLMLAYLGSAILVCYSASECRKRRRLAAEAWELFKHRYHYVACLAQDEAINGLRKSQNGISGPLLPPMPAPVRKTTAVPVGSKRRRSCRCYFAQTMACARLEASVFRNQRLDCSAVL